MHSPAVLSHDGREPCQRPICKCCGEELYSYLLLAIDLPHGKNFTAAGVFLKAWLLMVTGTKLAPSLQLCKKNLHHVLQVTPLSENACLEASGPGTTESQSHYWCRTDLFGAAKKCVRQAEAEVCGTIVKTAYRYLLAETTSLKIQLTFKAWHFPTPRGPLMGFHMFISCLPKRSMNILTARHVLICGTGRSQALNILESVLPVTVPGHLHAGKTKALFCSRNENSHQFREPVLSLLWPQ